MRNSIIIYLLFILKEDILLKEKRFYTRETINGIRVLPLAEFSLVFPDWLR